MIKLAYPQANIMAEVRAKYKIFFIRERQNWQYLMHVQVFVGVEIIRDDGLS